MYCLLNPDVDHPYQPVFVEEGLNESIDSLKLLLSDKRLPKPQPKYEFLQVPEWGQVLEAFETCAKFEPELRPLASELLPIFSVDQSKASLNVVHLAASQSTALEQMDHALALREGDVQAVDESPAVIAPENDGTNACVFLCLAICNCFLATESMTWEDLKIVAEDTISEFPLTINGLRDVNSNYDPMSAYSILKNNGLIAFDEEECFLIVTSRPDAR